MGFMLTYVIKEENKDKYYSGRIRKTEESIRCLLPKFNGKTSLRGILKTHPSISKGSFFKLLYELLEKKKLTLHK